MSLAPLPSQAQPLVDEEGKVTLPWQAALDGIVGGDGGNTWTPTFTGLTVSGTPTFKGVYYQISNTLVYYAITIIPATSTTSVAGTTYCDNFPFTITNAGANITVSGFTASAGGTTASDKRIYPAAWSAITTPITIIGIAEVS